MDAAILRAGGALPTAPLLVLGRRTSPKKNNNNNQHYWRRPDKLVDAIEQDSEVREGKRRKFLH